MANGRLGAGGGGCEEGGCVCYQRKWFGLAIMRFNLDWQQEGGGREGDAAAAAAINAKVSETAEYVTIPIFLFLPLPLSLF